MCILSLINKIPTISAQILFILCNFHTPSIHPCYSINKWMKIIFLSGGFGDGGGIWYICGEIFILNRSLGLMGDFSLLVNEIFWKMKRILIGLLLAVACVNLAWADGELRPALADGEQKSALADGELGLALDALNNPKAQRVLVVSHRGDWRNAPENSIPAMLNCVAMGVDMVEIDLHMTKDGHLVLMHDKKVDRTTNGKGEVKNLTLAEIKQLRLRNGMWRVTTVQVPTMEEVFAALKGKVLINVDKGYDYFDEVYAAARRLDMVDQIVIKAKGRLKKIQKEKGDVIQKSIFMPIVHLDVDSAEQVLDEFLAIRPVAVECCFKTVTPTVERLLKKIDDAGVKVWINTLWPSLNGGHDDDRAVIDGDPDGAWGWALNHYAQFLQTDRPALLIEYLKQQGRR